MFHVPAWVYIIVFLSILLFLIALLLFYFVCVKQKVTQRKFYILNEDGLTEARVGLINQSSADGTTPCINKNEAFTVNDLPIMCIYDKGLRKSGLSDADLSKIFSNSRLSLDRGSSDNLDDDMKSCISMDSKTTTFYSPFVQRSKVFKDAADI